jgi:hypothetical protein
MEGQIVPELLHYKAKKRDGYVSPVLLSTFGQFQPCEFSLLKEKVDALLPALSLTAHLDINRNRFLFETETARASLDLTDMKQHQLTD